MSFPRAMSVMGFLLALDCGSNKLAPRADGGHAGASGGDAGTSEGDAGASGGDAGATGDDAGTSEGDAGVTGGDAGAGHPDRLQYPRVSAGASHTCAVAIDGVVACWGTNKDSELGDGTDPDTDRPLPGPVVGVQRALAIAAGSYHTCALAMDDTVYCWGWNVSGQIGNSTTSNGTTAFQVPGLASVIAVATGDAHSCALVKDGSARCWGQNDLGQLGDGSQINRGMPVGAYSRCRPPSASPRPEITPARWSPMVPSNAGETTIVESWAMGR